MIACAAEEIIADPSSIVGSIGVVGASFGFDEAIKRLGIERRVYTAGEHKVMLDPFQPEKAEDVARLRAIQQQIHDNFIGLVKASRGSRLAGQEKTLFSGEYWAGQKALEFGLIDRIGELRAALRERYGEDVLMPVIAASRGWFSRVMPAAGFANDGGEWIRAGLADEVVSAIEARALWARFASETEEHYAADPPGIRMDRWNRGRGRLDPRFDQGNGGASTRCCILARS